MKGYVKTNLAIIWTISKKLRVNCFRTWHLELNFCFHLSKTFTFITANNFKYTPYITFSN